MERNTRQTLITFLLFTFIIFDSCNKDPNNSTGNNSNGPISVNCPVVSNGCKFQSLKKWIWVNSPNQSHYQENSITYPYLETWESGLTLYYNSEISQRFTIELKNDCTTIGLRDYTDKRFLRDITVVANDSILKIRDPILCPDGDCLFIYTSGNTNNPYNRYIQRNKSISSCKFLNNYSSECVCSVNTNGNNCKNLYFDFDLLNKEHIISSVILPNKNIIVEVEDDSKRILSQISSDNKILWTLDISNTIVPSYPHIYRYYNQQNLLLWGDKFLFFYDFKDAAGSYLKILIIDINGKILDTKSFKYPNGKYNTFINVSQFKNGNILVISGNGTNNNYSLFTSDLQFILLKNFIENPISRNLQLNHFCIFENNLYFFYPEPTDMKFEYYVFDNNLAYKSNSSVSTQINGSSVIPRSFSIFQDKIIVQCFGYNARQEGINSADAFIIYDINTFKPISSNIIYSRFLSSSFSETAFLPYLKDDNLYVFNIGNSSSDVTINKYLVSNGKLVFQYIFNTEISKYSPVSLISSYSNGENIDIIMDGVYFNQSIIKYSFNENSLYPKTICQ